MNALAKDALKFDDALLSLLIIGLVVTTVAVLRKYRPMVASRYWPTLAVLLGTLSSLCLYFMGLEATMNPVKGMLLGLAGIGVRELVSKWNSAAVVQLSRLKTRLKVWRSTAPAVDKNKTNT